MHDHLSSKLLQSCLSPVAHHTLSPSTLSIFTLYTKSHSVHASAHIHTPFSATQTCFTVFAVGLSNQSATYSQDVLQATETVSQFARRGGAGITNPLEELRMYT